MTVRELKDQLAALDPLLDHSPIVAWLPGSRLELVSVIPRPNGGEILIEANVREEA